MSELAIDRHCLISKIIGESSKNKVDKFQRIPRLQYHLVISSSRHEERMS